MSSLALPTVGLAIRQPWAWLVLNGKDVENRKWNTRFRGDFLIHAAKGMTHAEYDDAIAFASKVDSRLVVPAFDDLPRGGIVGRASLVGVLLPCRTVEPCAHPWHMPEQHGFLLEGVATLPFVPCRGALGFFKVGDDIVRELAARSAP